MKKTSLFLFVTALVMTLCISLGALAAGTNDVLSADRISVAEGDIVFDIAINNEGASYESAYAVVAVYSSQRELIEMAKQPISNADITATVKVGFDYDIALYQLMLLSSDGNLRPLCPAVEANLSPAELDGEEDKEYAKTIELLSGMDIINVNDLETKSPLYRVTRAEFAAVLCRAMDFGSQAAAFCNEGIFEDVPSDHWASGYINVLCQSGIIEAYSQGAFCPDEAISYQDALKALVYAVGYKPMETVLGGYKKIARDTGITSGVTAQEFVSMKLLATLTQNILSVPKLEPTSYGSPDEVDWEIMDGKMDRDYVNLLVEKDLYIATGIVTDFYDGYAEIIITEDSDDWEFEEGDYVEFRIGSSDIKDYQFQNVDIYAKKVARREYEIVGIKPSAIGKTLNIKSEDVETLTDTSLGYRVNGAMATIKLDIAQIVFNHSYDYDMVNEVVAMDDVYLKFIENTGDDKYDVLVAEKYSYAYVDEVDAQEGTIMLGGITIYPDFEDEYVTIELTNFAGEKLALADFAAGDVVAYISDGPSVKAYDRYLKIVNLYDNIVAGTVKEKGPTYVVLADGSRYENPFECELELGGEYALYIGFGNRIVDVIAVSDIPQRPEKQPEEEPEQVVEEASDYKDNVSLLNSLDIININGLEKSEPDHLVTKAEFAAVLVRSKGYNKETELFRNENVFSDVSSDHWAAGYINFAAKKNVFASNEGEFCPEEPITYTEAIRSAVNFLGYEPMTTIWGNNSAASIRVASKQGMIDGLKPDVYFTFENLATLTANLIKAPLMTITEIIGENIDWEIMDGKQDRDYRTLLADRDIYVATGIVAQLYGGYAEVIITENSDDWEFEEDEYYEFEINGSNIGDYQFQNVDVYVKKNKTRDYEVIAVVPSGVGETFTIVSEQVNSANDRMVEYYVDFPNSSATKEIKIELNSFVYNNMWMDAYDFTDVVCNSDVQLKFIENTGDNRYDVLVAKSYMYEELAFVDAATNRIAIGGRTAELDFEDEEIRIILRNDAGKKLTLADFSEGDIIAYAMDGTKITNSDYIEIVKISQNTVTGTVEEIRSLNGYDYFMVDGKNYANNSDYDFELGETYKFFIGLTGKVVYGTTDLNYGEDTDGDDTEGDAPSDGDEENAVLPQTMAYGANVKLLTDINILNINNLENAEPTYEITNGELAAVVVKMLNLEADLMSKLEAALMASYGHWAEPYINLLREMNIVDSSDSFLPDEKPSYVLALKTLVRALGYEPLLNAMGGTTAEYIDVANISGLVAGVDATDGVTADTLAALVANGVNIPVMKATRLSGAKPVWEILDGRKGRNYETILTGKNIFIADGIVMELEGKYVYVYVTEDSYDMEFWEGDDYVFLIGDSDIADYLLQNVKVYVEKTAGGNYKVISVQPGAYGSSIEILSNNVRNTDGRILSYYSDYPACTEIKEIKLNNYDMVVMYNNSICSYDVEELISREFVELKFIENTGDTKYDAVIATKYHDAMVDYVDVENNTMVIYDEPLVLDTSDEERTIILCDAKGNKLSLEDFGENDVVAIASDLDDVLAFDRYIKIVRLTELAVTGVVEENYSANGNDFAVINGKEYIDYGADFHIGDKGIFYIDLYGGIINFEPDVNYGYILETNFVENNFEPDKWQMKLLTEDNDVILVDLSDQASEDYTDVYGKEFTWQNTDEEEVSADANLNAERLIMYELNSRGELKYFECCDNPEGWQTFDGVYNKADNTVAGKKLKSGMTVIAIGIGDCNYLYSADIDDLTDGDTYTGAVYKDYNGKTSVMVVTTGNVKGTSKYSQEKYGYILEGAYEIGTFEDGWYLNLLTKDGGAEKYALTESAGEAMSARFSDGVISWTEASLGTNRLVTYCVNINGEISSLKFATDTGAIKAIKDKTYNAADNTIGDLALSEDTVVFAINSSYPSDTMASDLTCLADNGVYSGGAFRNADGKYEVLIVTKGDIGEVMYPGEQKKMGYIVSTLSDEDERGDVYYTLQILKADGKTEDYILSDTAVAYYESAYGDTMFTPDGDVLNSKRLVSYIVKKDGVIRSFKPMTDGENTSFEIVEGEFSKDTMSLGGKVIDNNAPVFYIAEMADGYTTTVTADYFEDGEDYAGVVYTDENGKCTAVVITEGNGVLDYSSGFAIVTKMSWVIDINGNEALKVDYVCDEKNGTVIFDEDSESVVYGFDISDLYIGTAFMFGADAGGVVSKYIPIATINDSALELVDGLDGIFDHTDVTIMGGYIANEGRITTSSGEVIKLDNGKLIPVDEGTNKYTYNDSGRNTVIEVGDFLGGDAYYFDDYGYEGEYTPVVVKVVDGYTVDIYTSSERQYIEY